MAPLTYGALARAHTIRAEAHRLRLETAALRRAARNSCHLHELVKGELAGEVERRARSSLALGTWPYWAPATPELMRVLVATPNAD